MRTATLLTISGLLLTLPMFFSGCEDTREFITSLPGREVTSIELRDRSSSWRYTAEVSEGRTVYQLETTQANPRGAPFSARVLPGAVPENDATYATAMTLFSELQKATLAEVDDRLRDRIESCREQVSLQMVFGTGKPSSTYRPIPVSIIYAESCPFIEVYQPTGIERSFSTPPLFSATYYADLDRHPALATAVRRVLTTHQQRGERFLRMQFGPQKEGAYFVRLDSVPLSYPLDYRDRHLYEATGDTVTVALNFVPGLQLKKDAREAPETGWQTFRIPVPTPLSYQFLVDENGRITWRTY